MSPFRAAFLPLIFTVSLPIMTVPLFAGGFWKDVPGGVGICGGRVVGGAVDGRRGLAHDLHVVRKAAVELAVEQVRQRRRNGGRAAPGP